MKHLWILEVFWMILSTCIHTSKVFVEGKGELDYLAVFLPQRTTAPFGGFNILEISATADTVVFLEIPYLGQKHTLTIHAGQVKTFRYPGMLRTTLEEFHSNKTIHIRTSRKVTVKGLNVATSSADSFLALPVGEDFTYFRGISYTQTNVRPRCVLAVTSLLGRNTIYVASTKQASFRYGQRHYRNGETLQVKLDRLQILQVESYDVTGLVVTSHSPVAVYSGCNCVSVPKFSADCDHVVEQMPPLTTWGTEFISAAIIPRRSGEIYRILSSCNRTEVRVNSQLYGVVDEGDFLEFKSKPLAMSWIQCSSPCLVAMFIQGYSVDNKRGDPSMSIVPHIGQWVPSISVSWSMQTGYGSRAKQNFNTIIHYIMLITDSVHTVGTLLNGKVLGSGRTWLPIPNTNYSATVFKLELGKYRIRHINPQVRLGSISFGLGAGVSYAHPGDLWLRASPDRGCKLSRLPAPSNIQGGYFQEAEVQVATYTPVVIALVCMCVVLLVIIVFLVFVTLRLRRNINRMAQQEKIIIVPRPSLSSNQTNSLTGTYNAANETASTNIRGPESPPPYIEIYDDR